MNVAQPAIASGDKGLAFLAGVGSGPGQVVSESAQLNVVEIGTGITMLITSQDARGQLSGQLTTMAGEVASGNSFVMGQIAGNLVPLGAAAKVGKTGSLFGKVDKYGLAKPLRLSTPSNTTSALGGIKSQLGGEGVNGFA